MDEDNMDADEIRENEQTEDYDAEAEGELAVAHSDRLISDLMAKNNPWGYGKKGIEAKRAAMTMLSTKTGMYAKVPLVCKADACPYAETCKLLQYDLAPEGEYCPVETSQIEMRLVNYASDIDIDNASFTDRVLLNEIIDCDIMLERCKALMSKEGTPVLDMAIGVDQDGNAITQPAVSKSWEAYERISKKRNDAFQLLMLTRKDHKNDAEAQTKSLSEILAEADDIIDDDGLKK